MGSRQVVTPACTIAHTTAHIKAHDAAIRWVDGRGAAPPLNAPPSSRLSLAPMSIVPPFASPAGLAAAPIRGSPTAAQTKARTGRTRCKPYRCSRSPPVTPRPCAAGTSPSPRGPQLAASDSSGMSVTNMCPGAWVMSSGTRAATATACGVTPQAQKTGTSPARTSVGSP